jgi:hypothetical protein
MGSMEIVVILPFSKLLVIENDVIRDAIFIEELIELLIINAMRSLDLSI